MLQRIIKLLKSSLIISFFIIIPIVFLMGFIGMVSFSLDSSTRPDLGFFTLLLKDQTELLSLLIIVLGLSLTISTVDTLVNAISSLFVVDGKATFNLDKKTDYLKFQNTLFIFITDSYLVLRQKDLIFYIYFCLQIYFVVHLYSQFFTVFIIRVNEKTAYISIIIGLIAGFYCFHFQIFLKVCWLGY